MHKRFRTDGDHVLQMTLSTLPFYSCENLKDCMNTKEFSYEMNS